MYSIANDNSNNNQNTAPIVVNSGSDGNAQAKTPLNIISGSFYTGSNDADKSYANIYVGTQHAGETVKITAVWSRNGNNLNSGKLVTVTVDSTGYARFHSAERFKYYPDHADVKLYYADGTLADSKSVTLSPTPGVQKF